MNDAKNEALKEVELNLLHNFLEICEKEKLRYFLLGGSCLGAVRHKGFIPWDDDIDVGLPRPDYERFIDCAQDFLPENVFLQTHKTDSEYLNNFAKFRASDTTFIESSCKNLKINHGIFIDIFPIDGAGDSEEAGKEQLRRINWYSRPICEKYYIGLGSVTEKLKKGIKNVVYPLLFPSIPKCIEKRESLYTELGFESSSYIANYGGAWGIKEIVPKCYFGEGCTAEFEGLAVIIPENYDGYLTHMYGDYMTPPPIENRVAHHYCDVIDPKKSYREYL